MGVRPEKLSSALEGVFREVARFPYTKICEN